MSNTLVVTLDGIFCICICKYLKKKKKKKKKKTLLFVLSFALFTCCF
jgi:predicted nucleic acid-binding Zn ribbon protein